ncbi:hypothetical protein [Methanobacterium sp. SMA-27]|uniref:hypothetical protein n=1 Tax=Methanobacterium sp. SMA-27 TaxID=1495336 RepID=UPI00064E27FB|nr:hypothetical protein [Methanobacterium sp. SMA-27]
MGYEFKPVKPSEIKNKVEKSIRLLLKYDDFLLYSDAHERSITHKLAEYLQSEFVEWNVDCEYNRKGHELPKQLKDWEVIYEEEINKDKEKIKNVFPDIIVHQRRTRSNLLVIEVKKSSNNDTGQSDKDKIKAFRNELGYKYGVFINFETDKKATIKDLKWFPSEKF